MLGSEVKSKAKTFSDRVLGTIKERRTHGNAEDDVMDTWAWAGPHGHYNQDALGQAYLGEGAADGDGLLRSGELRV